MSRSKNTSATVRNVALCYIRQSFTRDENDIHSPDRQRANCLTYCQSRGWTPEFYEDADGHKSGTKEENRPGWLALKSRLASPEVVALVANDLSRVHRKGYRVGQLMEICQQYGLELVMAAGGRSFDLSDVSVKMWIMMEALFAEYYAVDISRKQKDSANYRRKLGITLGQPPFGTSRDKNGYLMPSKRGVWLLPDGSYVSGTENDPPVAGGLWRGYYACAERILTFYSQGNYGYHNVAYQVSAEGWLFRERNDEPRPLNGDDVRRVVGNWREYAGIVTEGRAKDKNASLLDDPVGILHDTGRAVFDLELLRQVALVQQTRSVTLRPAGAKRTAAVYPLTNLLYCAHCERDAHERNDPKLRSRFSGWLLKGVPRYRHTEGRTCTAKHRSVPATLIENDFGRLLRLLTIDQAALHYMTELAIHSEMQASALDLEYDLEAQKSHAIAKCRRRIEAARHLYEDGELTREDYLKRKEQNEREIAHWETRTTETQKIALELAMCLDALEKIALLWEAASNEDKQGMARSLFEYIVYDVDAEQITDFRLKPWADRFIVLRAALYADSGSNREARNNETTDVDGGFKSGTVSCPYGAFSSHPYTEYHMLPNASSRRCIMGFHPLKPGTTMTSRTDLVISVSVSVTTLVK